MIGETFGNLEPCRPAPARASEDSEYAPLGKLGFMEVCGLSVSADCALLIRLQIAELSVGLINRA